MTVSAELIQRAKQKAILFLEHNIVTLAVLLGLDVDELDSSYVIPVEASDPAYSSHYCLQQMLLNLDKAQL